MALIEALIARCNGSPSLRAHLLRQRAQLLSSRDQYLHPAETHALHHEDFHRLTDRHSHRRHVLRAGPRWPGARRTQSYRDHCESTRARPADQKPPGKNEVRIEIKDGFRVITANNIPAHLVGKFPNPGNPNTISPQKFEIKLPLDPKPSDRITDARMAVGIALNGVLMESGTGEFWTGGKGREWNYEALGGALAFGLDANYAHVQPNGKYHYHGKPTGLLADFEISPQAHSPLVGWAFDGFPIYALYGYSNPEDSSSKIIEMTSSYRLKSGERPSGSRRPRREIRWRFHRRLQIRQSLRHSR